MCACSRLAGAWLYGPQISREDIKILPNAIEVEKYHYMPLMRKEMRNKLGIEDKIVIGNGGRYCYPKNQEFLLRVFAKAVRQNKKLFLILIGEGELEKKIRDLIKKLEIENNVLCLDWQDNVEDYLQAMDIFCLPSFLKDCRFR